MSSFPFCANSGQYFATGANGIDRAPVDRNQTGKGGKCFGAGEEVDDGVFFPWRRLGAIGVTTPDVDDALAVDVEGKRRTELLALADLVGERLGELVESAVPVTVYDFTHADHHAGRAVFCSGNRKVAGPSGE